MSIIDSSNENEFFTQSMDFFKKHLHKEWIFDIAKPCLIEPEIGIVFNSWGSYLYRSFNYYVIINYRNFSFHSWLRIILKRKTPEYDTIFSLRDTNEGNYWHFFDDQLSKLRFFDQLDLNADTPVLVGKNLWNMHFFQYVINHTGFKHYNWIQQTEIIRSKRTIIAVPSSLKKENFQFFLNKAAINLTTGTPRLLFVNRSLQRGRTISNIEEIKPVLHKYNIQLVENDNLSFADQMNIYKDASLLIGIHGAGLVNLIYRMNKPTGLLEIFHPGTIHPHYVWMSKAFHFKYHCIVGSNVDASGNFYIDPVLFEQKIKIFIKKALLQPN
jgi:capsular polysaccharide biosynthesis protein